MIGSDGSIDQWTVNGGGTSACRLRTSKTGGFIGREASVDRIDGATQRQSHRQRSSLTVTKSREKHLAIKKG